MPTDDDFLADEKGFTVDPRFQARHEKQRERAARMEEGFLAELKEAFRKDRARLAKEFVEYHAQNPAGARVQSPLKWTGEVKATDMSEDE